MTSLTRRKSKLVFQTSDLIRERGKYREVVIEAQPDFAMVRLAGMRTAFPVSWGAVYHFAARAQAERVKREKRAKRAAKANRGNQPPRRRK